MKFLCTWTRVSEHCHQFEFRAYFTPMCGKFAAMFQQMPLAAPMPWHLPCGKKKLSKLSKCENWVESSRISWILAAFFLSCGCKLCRNFALDMAQACAEQEHESWDDYKICMVMRFIFIHVSRMYLSLTFFNKQMQTMTCAKTATGMLQPDVLKGKEYLTPLQPA